MMIFLLAAFTVALAEMGDKTQLLAMAFATKYKAKDIFIGIFVATVLNHGLAVLLGTFISKMIPMSYVQIAAGLSFVGFALWTLKGDTLDDEDKKQTKFGPVFTVAIAFFIAELGDKTQLFTISLAAKYDQPWFILAGTTTGMMIADALGIIIGMLMGRKIPDHIIKWVSVAMFSGFGLWTLAEAFSQMMKVQYDGLLLFCIAAIGAVIGYGIYKRGGGNKEIRGSEASEEDIEPRKI